jgi:hypothetical protein
VQGKLDREAAREHNQQEAIERFRAAMVQAGGRQGVT